MQVAAIVISMCALVITVAGWIVNYRLNSSTQKRAFINSLTNDARLQITDAIRDVHDWCIEITTVAETMSVDDIVSLGQTDEPHQKRQRELRILASERRSWIWVRRLEEYETLFPGTADVRVRILKMLQDAGELARNRADKHAPGSPPSKNEVAEFSEAIFDVLSLTWDLLIYLQNESIGRITGNKIPERRPAEICPIRLVSDKEGCLTTVHTS